MGDDDRENQLNVAYLRTSLLGHVCGDRRMHGKKSSQLQNLRYRVTIQVSTGDGPQKTDYLSFQRHKRGEHPRCWPIFPPRIRTWQETWAFFHIGSSSAGYFVSHTGYIVFHATRQELVASNFPAIIVTCLKSGSLTLGAMFARMMLSGNGRWKLPQP